MNDFNYDLLVIGSGPAGESAALNTAKRGLRTAIIEDRPAVGGGCTHSGTIPSKALRHAVQDLVRYNSNPIFRAIGEQRRLSFQQLMQNADAVIRKQVGMRSRYYSKNRIEVHTGVASFIDRNTVSVLLPDGARETLTAEHVVIATGSRPYRPEGIDFNHPSVFDSDTILTMPNTPRRVLIFGAGVIGCEYACMFAALGVTPMPPPASTL